MLHIHLLPRRHSSLRACASLFTQFGFSRASSPRLRMMRFLYRVFSGHLWGSYISFSRTCCSRNDTASSLSNSSHETIVNGAASAHSAYRGFYGLWVGFPRVAWLFSVFSPIWRRELRNARRAYPRTRSGGAAQVAAFAAAESNAFGVWHRAALAAGAGRRHVDHRVWFDAGCSPLRFCSTALRAGAFLCAPPRCNKRAASASTYYLFYLSFPAPSRSRLSLALQPLLRDVGRGT